MYAEDDYLLLSGIQHFLFCPRQWALIHLEQIWHDNGYTAEGQVLHKKADQPFLKEKRNGLIVRFSMNKPPAMLVVGIKSFSFK
ncbi:MAG: Dna2/Cas4 domain-containing protein [Peptococcus niger]|nr:Dna2/Cas4 domain-containing protein [Peptococcus niger]